MPRSTYFAHSNKLPNQKDWHRLSDHLESTGNRAAEFLDGTGCGDFGKAAGLLHDLGKYTREFQKRLAGGPRCDHATAGAKVAVDRYRRPFGIRILENNGFRFVRQTGSHRRFTGIVRGQESDDMTKPTLASIRRQSGLTRSEFRPR